MGGRERRREGGTRKAVEGSQRARVEAVSTASKPAAKKQPEQINWSCLVGAVFLLRIAHLAAAVRTPPAAHCDWVQGWIQGRQRG